MPSSSSLNHRWLGHRRSGRYARHARSCIPECSRRPPCPFWRRCRSRRRRAETLRLCRNTPARQHLGQPGLPRLDSAPTVRPFLNDQSAAQRYSAFDKCQADPDGARIRIRRILDQVLPAQFLKKALPSKRSCCLDSGCSVWRTVVSSERSSVSGKGIFVVRRGQPTSLRLPSVRPSAVGGARRALPNRFLPV